MADPILQTLYPEDITGVATTNKVVKEFQSLNPPEGEFDYHWLIPKATPFFRDTLELYHSGTGRKLIRGSDWAPGHKFVTASFELQGIKGGIYASVLLLNKALAGQVELRVYQTLGGNWTLNATKILELLDAKAVDPRFVTYDEVSGKPDVFPPTEHNHPADDLTGMRELVDSNYDVAAAIREQTQDWLNNPPILFSEYLTKDETLTLLEDVGGGSDPADLELIVTSMTNAFGKAADDLAAIQDTGTGSVTGNMVLLVDSMKADYDQAATDLSKL